MNKPGNLSEELKVLIESAMEGSLTAEQEDRLNQMLEEDPSLRRLYCEYIQLSVLLEQVAVEIPAVHLWESEAVLDEGLWGKLAL